MKRNIIWLALFLGIGTLINAQNNPVELGEVEWLRNMDTAVARSKIQDKPILVLFQEVPGCSTCQNYGKNVLSHPLIVEAIEAYFIPLCIHNNKKGEDAKTLAYFNEPTWNNPVVRIVASNKLNIVKRVSGQYSQLALVQSMMEALVIRGQNIPKYLNHLEQYLYAEEMGLETIYLSMYCFWSGELNLGQLKGVYATKAGFMDGKEVVEVQYLPNEISIHELLKVAKKSKCGDGIYCESKALRKEAKVHYNSKQIKDVKSFKLDKDPKYYLSQTAYKYVPMTAYQACRANSLIGRKEDCHYLFSPRQLEVFAEAKRMGGEGMENMVERGL